MGALDGELIAGRGTRGGYCSADAGPGPILKVGGDDGRAVVVVARVEDQADRVPDPLGGLYGT